MDRRKFLKVSAAGLLGLTQIDRVMAGLAAPEGLKVADYTVDRVALGDSGIVTSRLALGTGSIGGNRTSNQTKMGADFVKMAHHAYERGITFFDMADAYGSHAVVNAALKGLPREKVTLLTKIGHQPDGTDGIEPVEKTLDRFRLELGTDYIDILLLHFVYRPGWEASRRHFIDGLSRAKEKGIVRAVGVSFHNLQAMSEAVESDWVDVIMARINPFGTNMDVTDPQSVATVLARAREKGKGLIGMKIFGEGKHVRDDEREASFRFALTESNVHCMTLGLESIPQLDDAVDRVMRLVKA